MAYKAKFLHFKTKQSYNTERNKTVEGTDERKVFDAYISFIDEGPTICTWGKEYKCEISKEEIETLIDSKGFITLEDIPNIPIAGTSLPEIAGTAAAGTSEKYAREDHIHPLQTSVTGNAGTATKLQTARTVSVSGAVSGSASFDGSQDVTINTTLANVDASKITSGTLNADRLPEIPIEKLPAGALERLVIVENQAARYQLTTSDVQEGDTVKQEDTGVMYFVVDTNNLANENGYKVYTAGAATSVAWSGVTGKPSTLEGYGISDSSVCEAIEREYGYTPLDPSMDIYPEDFTWNNGTTEGPVGVLTGGNMEAITFPAIPAASGEQSGIVTTAAQTFYGDKTFMGNVTVDSTCNSYEVYSTYAHLSQIENQGGGTTPIYIGSGGEHSISYDGSEYTGNAATATKVQNKLTFTGAVTGEYDGSSALTVNIPESSGSEIPIALPNPYRLNLGGKFYDGSTAVTVDYLPNQYALTINGSTYNGSSAVTVNTLYPLAEISYATSTTDIGYGTSSGIHAGYVYYPSLWTLSNKNRTIHVKCDKFDFNKPSTIVIIYGEGTVSFEYANGYLLKQNNIITTASSSNSYRLYCFSYLAGKGTNTRVAVNCSEYTE